MPTASSTVTEVIEPLPRMSTLRFDESLSWRAGKPLTIADLLRRLQILAQELQGLEQEDIPREGFRNIPGELVKAHLLAHKDKGVKAWTAHCLVDILRLFAPDAPYTGMQLRDIFNMIISSILPSLSDPSNAYNNQHLYVLNSLASFKSIVLLSDLPSSEHLIFNLFATFFDMLSGSNISSTGEQLGKTVELEMTSILATMVDETTSLPVDVIDVIVAQFLRTDPRALAGSGSKSKKNGVVDEKQSTLVLKDLPPAYNMAKTICNSCPEKMARQMSQYFNDVIVDASAPSTGKKTTRRNSIDDSDDEGGSGPTEEDLKELRKAHQLLKELWRACPAVLQNVIPQLEAELSAENVQLRHLATEALGDIISGIGSAGLESPPSMDPAAYPSMTLSDDTQPRNQNLLTKPSSPQPFPQAHPHAYATFLGRKHDKSPIIRSAWTMAIGRILSTSAGGAGLSKSEEEQLIGDLNRMMADADEKVRVAAVKVIGSFTLQEVITKLGPSGNVATTGSVLATLAERVRDKKHVVRSEAMKVLGRLWGVASGEIMDGNEVVTPILEASPSKILDTYYANDLEIHVLLDQVMFEELLPLSYPPVKAKSTKLTNGDSQRSNGSQTVGEPTPDSVDPDKLRIERILTLVKSLDERAKKIFYSIQVRQTITSKVFMTFLQRCEDYNGGVMDENEAAIKEHLKRLIENLAKQLPDHVKATGDLWKFAKMHDRRSYQLIRFCMAPESDYRTMYKAFKEFIKRIENATNTPKDLLDTLVPLLYRVSMIIYNKSHVPAIMEYSRTDEKALGATAHEVLRELSSRTPEVLKAHVQEMCKRLQEEAPTVTKANQPDAVDNLKACASFAMKFPEELPKDRKFVQSLTNFALFGSPPTAAKHAVTILMTASRKEMVVKDLVTKCVKDFEYGGAGFLSRLAALSQLMLLASIEIDDESDLILDIAIKQILLQVRSPSTASSETYAWSDEVDDECEAKCWALKILVNRIRSYESQEDLGEVAKPVYKLLATLVAQRGELASAKNTPPDHKPRLRLLAARLYLKLCTKKSHDVLLTPDSFNQLALVAQDQESEVRSAFIQRLKKYLGKTRLSQRFYVIPFLLAFEPSTELKSNTATWIRSRAAYLPTLTQQGSGGVSKPSTVLESVFARLISLLSHHPDYSPETEDLVDFTRYILFYLQNVANADNLSLIFHIAQRVKQTRDAITSSEFTNEALWTLSDLAQLAIRKFEEEKGWIIDVIPFKVRLPATLFTEVKGHAEALSVAERNFLPEDVEEGVEKLVKSSLRKESSRSRKRKSDVDGGADGEGGTRKKAKLPIRKATSTKEKKPKPTAAKTPKPKKKSEKNSDVGSGERRRSGRVSTAQGGKYKERDDEDDDEEMVDGVAEWIYEDEDGNSIEPEPVAEVSSNKDAEESEAEEASQGKEEDLGVEATTNGDVEDELAAEESEPATPPAKTAPRSKAKPKATTNSRKGASKTALSRKKNTPSTTPTSSPKATKTKKAPNTTSATTSSPKAKTRAKAPATNGGLSRPTRATRGGGGKSKDDNMEVI